MSVMSGAEWIEGGVTAAKGFKAAGAACGIKQSGRKDLALIFSERPASAAAVFTRSGVPAAPVVVSRKHARAGMLRAIVVNSGNANACTGESGIEHAIRMARAMGQALRVSAWEVLVCSTGVIGVPLPIERVEGGIGRAASAMSTGGHSDAAEAVLTTDTCAKERAARLKTRAGYVTVGGMAKGSGMIAPNLATMLAFVTTDIAVAPEVLARLLKRSIAVSFNAITVDGAMSTNDTVAVLANGASGVDHAKLSGGERRGFAEMLKEVCVELAKLIVKDGEGATKFIEVTVKNAARPAQARGVARAVAESPLVKTAFFGEDPNWGRIMAAIGSASSGLDPSAIDVSIGGEQVVLGGLGVGFSGDALKRALGAREIGVLIDLKRGSSSASMWTSDLSYDYVRINAEYHT